MTKTKTVLSLFSLALSALLGGSTAQAANVDLVVQGITHNASTNQVEVTVANLGTDSLPGAYHYLYVWGGAGSVERYVPVPDAGASLVVGVPLSDLGSGYQVGSTYYMYAYADDYSQIAESNENNNGFSAYVWIRGTAQPDFLVQGIADVANSPNVAVTYSNMGSVASSTAPVIRVAAGSTSVDVTGVALAAGATGSVNVSKAALGLVLNANNAISANVDPGNLIAEGNESNNSRSATVYVTAPVTAADYQVTGLALDSTNTKINVTYLNAGASTSTYSYLYLNVAGIGKSVYVAGLAQNASATTQFNVSDFAMSGGNQYSTYATADYYNAIVESSESNNSKSAMLYLPPGSGGGGGGGLADLIVQDMTVSYGAINVIVKNQGGTSASAFYLYLSGNSRTYTLYVSSSTPVAAGQSRTFSISTSNLGWYGGSLPIFAEVDHWNYVMESNESNNTLTKNLTFTYGP